MESLCIWSKSYFKILVKVFVMNQVNVNDIKKPQPFAKASIWSFITIPYQYWFIQGKVQSKWFCFASSFSQDSITPTLILTLHANALVRLHMPPWKLKWAKPLSSLWNKCNLCILPQELVDCNTGYIPHRRETSQSYNSSSFCMPD